MVEFPVVVSMSYTIIQETFDSLTSLWKGRCNNLRWEPLFVLPAWLEAWWQSFGAEEELYLRSVRSGNEIIGIAPLMLRGDTASIIGSDDVCDFLDFIVAPGREKEFFSVLLDDLRQKGTARLDLKTVRPDSSVMTGLIPLAKERKYKVICEENAVSVEVDLPSTWDEYLNMLDKKQRHELRRKLRRLESTAGIDYNCKKPTVQEIDGFMDTFLKLFSLTRKAEFMTPRMESFFRSLARAMTRIGLLGVSTLKLNGHSIAVTLGFDYNQSLYFYNNAYDPGYSHLSVGIISKVLCLREGIREGKKKGDFLKGREPYKYHIGGKEAPLYSCQITLE